MPIEFKRNSVVFRDIVRVEEAEALLEALQKNPERARQIMERIPAARWGNPEDLAGAAVFLASGASDYVHGHILVVDGGWLNR